MFKDFFKLLVIVVDTKSSAFVVLIFVFIEKLLKEYLHLIFSNNAINRLFYYFIIYLDINIASIVVLIRQEFYNICIDKIDKLSIKRNKIIVIFEFVNIANVENADIL